MAQASSVKRVLGELAGSIFVTFWLARVRFLEHREEGLTQARFALDGFDVHVWGSSYGRPRSLGSSARIP
jgi:hypothetical protein